MIGAPRQIFSRYRDAGGRVLVILVTDGEPSDGQYSDLKRCLQSAPSNIYISMVECNDNEEEMDYLSDGMPKSPGFTIRRIIPKNWPSSDESWALMSNLPEHTMFR